MDGKRYVFTTGVKVTTKDWDKKRERCKSNHEANTKLEHIRKEAERCLESGIVPESLKIKPEDQKKDKQPSKKSLPNTGLIKIISQALPIQFVNT